MDVKFNKNNISREWSFCFLFIAGSVGRWGDLKTVGLCWLMERKNVYDGIINDDVQKDVLWFHFGKESVS